MKTFEDIANQMVELQAKKNADYDNAYIKSLHEEGYAAARITLGNKLSRFKHISKNNTAQVKGESMEDTLIDLAAYALMTLQYMYEIKHRARAKPAYNTMTRQELHKEYGTLLNKETQDLGYSEEMTQAIIEGRIK